MKIISLPCFKHIVYTTAFLGFSLVSHANGNARKTSEAKRPAIVEAEITNFKEIQGFEFDCSKKLPCLANLITDAQIKTKDGQLKDVGDLYLQISCDEIVEQGKSLNQYHATNNPAEFCRFQANRYFRFLKDAYRPYRFESYTVAVTDFFFEESTHTLSSITGRTSDGKVSVHVAGITLTKTFKDAPSKIETYRLGVKR